MSEKLKTRSEVLAELEADAKVIENHFTCAEILANESGKYLRILIGSQGDTWSGKKHFFSPDTDTKTQALEKAQKLQMDKTSDETVKDCSLTNGMKYYVVDWVTKIDKLNHSEKFPFADPAPKSEFITDEPPLEGTPVKGSKGVKFLSRGKFLENGMLSVVDANGTFGPCKTYRSLTTPHRSKDWVD